MYRVRPPWIYAQMSTSVMSLLVKGDTSSDRSGRQALCPMQCHPQMQYLNIYYLGSEWHDVIFWSRVKSCILVQSATVIQGRDHVIPRTHVMTPAQ